MQDVKIEKCHRYFMVFHPTMPQIELQIEQSNCVTQIIINCIIHSDIFFLGIIVLHIATHIAWLISLPELVSPSNKYI